MMTAAERQEMREVFDEAVRAGLQPIVDRIMVLEELVKHPLIVLHGGQPGASTDPKWRDGACSNQRKE